MKKEKKTNCFIITNAIPMLNIKFNNVHSSSFLPSFFIPISFDGHGHQTTRP